MKASELKPCTSCGKGMMHDDNPIFYKITMETMGIDIQAVREIHGLEMMLGKAAPLASVLGTNPDIAMELDTTEHLICLKCLLKSTDLSVLLETSDD